MCSKSQTARESTNQRLRDIGRAAQRYVSCSQARGMSDEEARVFKVGTCPPPGSAYISRQIGRARRATVDSALFDRPSNTPRVKKPHEGLAVSGRDWD